MQTFLPVADFEETARFLDPKRLGKQRSETMIIYNTLSGVYVSSGKRGWPHHPATKMWTGFETALLRYGIVICQEWARRGFKGDSTLRWFEDRYEAAVADRPDTESQVPPWLGDATFHASHRSNLLRKDADYYRKFWPDDPSDLPYVWPTNNNV